MGAMDRRRARPHRAARTFAARRRGRHGRRVSTAPAVADQAPAVVQAPRPPSSKRRRLPSARSHPPSTKRPPSSYARAATPRFTRVACTAWASAVSQACRLRSGRCCAAVSPLLGT
eukprot:1554913-Pleurochrysis_carterae.AAC.1